MPLVSPALCPDPAVLPAPGRPQAVAPALERLGEAAGRDADPDLAGFVAALAADPVGSALLAAVFGNSPHLTQSVLAEPGFFRDLVRAGPDGAFHAALRLCHAAAEDDLAALMRRLRRAKRRAALAVALADITGAWALDKVTGALTDLAEAALGAACFHLLGGAGAAGEMALADAEDPQRGSGLIVLGMGKLGARELNYSSDIDLIVLYDPDRAHYTGKRDVQQFFVRLTQALVKAIEERTADGYVFRTDLRLRPDPGSTPIAMPVLAAEAYYESAGQNWERAAMTKARPIAGDREAGQAFLDILRPFMWRKSLDFFAIQDIHSIKRQIHAHRGGGSIAVAGHNIKLGRGGIREIEFFAQTQQLIWGGREPALRERDTCKALAALAAGGKIDAATRDRLTAAYRFLRRVEHRLQMIDDHQTHLVPDSEEARSVLAAFLGYADREAFEAALVETLRAVESCYAGLFEEAPDLSGPGNLVFTGSDDDPDTLETIGRLGYREPARVSALIRAWHHGRYRATRSGRARELLTELVPAILQAFSRTVRPDEALLRFNEFLAGLPAGVQLFAMFHSQPGLLDLLAEIMGSAPRLAETLSRHPILLDGVLNAGFFDALPSRDALAADLEEALSQARDYQDVLDILRRWANDRRFQCGVHMLRGRVDAETVGASLSDIADAVLAASLEAVEEEFARGHGRIEGGALAVVALGKLGGREMTVGSDLDLLFVYDAPPDTAGSDGARPLSPGPYFARLCQRFIGAVTAPTGEGSLYEVDMRLRPSGNAGPIATALDAFLKYQHESAWTWEHMALTRARVVAAPKRLRGAVEEAVRSVLTRPRDPERLRAEVADMRVRIEREHGTANPWAIKHYRGGLVDVEFIAQYLQLRHAHEMPEVLAANTTDALDRLAASGALERGAADELIEAMHLWRRVQGLLRLSLGGEFIEAEAPEGLKSVLARGTGEAAFGALRERVIETAARAHAHFERIIGPPAEAPTRSGDAESA